MQAPPPNQDQPRDASAKKVIENMGNLFGLPEQKMCPCCKEVLPKECFQKHRAKTRHGKDIVKLNSKCKKCHNKKATERNRRPSRLPILKETRRRYVIKKRAMFFEQWIKDNQGELCEMQWHKCAKCGKVRLYKNKHYENCLCPRCEMFESRKTNGFPIKEKALECIRCNRSFVGKNAGTMCYSCRLDTKRKRNRKARKPEDKSIRSRARKAGVYIEVVNRKVVYERDKYKCKECGVKVVISKTYQPNMATIDHIVPISLGGPHTYSNVRTLCHSCNSKRGNTIDKPTQLTLFNRDREATGGIGKT